MDSPASPDDVRAARAELARVVAEIEYISAQRFAVPGGAGDALLRDQLETLQGKANRLSIELSGSELYPPAPRVRREWLGWVVLAAAVVGILAVALSMF